MSDPRLPSLAQRLKAATGDEHRRVETTGLMAGLLRGRIERSDYVALLHNLRAIYAALEPALQRQAARAGIGPVVLPELFRCEAIECDLAALESGTGAVPVALQPATDAYVQRLRELEARQPELLVAHAYVRYLGDLSGGQQLRRIVARALDLPGAAGTSFYDFGDAARVASLAQRFRSGLDAVGAGGADAEAIVAEARSAFGRHCHVFDQLAANAS